MQIATGKFILGSIAVAPYAFTKKRRHVSNGDGSFPVNGFE